MVTWAHVKNYKQLSYSSYLYTSTIHSLYTPTLLSLYNTPYSLDPYYIYSYSIDTGVIFIGHLP